MARTWFQGLGIPLFGPDPSIEERRVKNARVTELQKIISDASVFERLAATPGWDKYMARVQAIRDGMMRQLRTAKMDEFPLLQARLKAFEEATEIVPAECARAKAANEELDGLIDETFQ